MCDYCNAFASSIEFIVSKKPKEYLKQGPTGCGGFSVKGILSAYGKDDKADPLQYYPLGIIGFGSTPSRWVKVLGAYGLDAELHSSRQMSYEEKLNTLKSLLRNDTPVMLFIGNGYRGNGIWSRIRWQMISHWITLWGFNDEKGMFYIYDSAVPLRYHDKNIPIGNVQRTYQEVVRDCGGGQPWWWRYTYITIPLR